MTFTAHLCEITTQWAKYCLQDSLQFTDEKTSAQGALRHLPKVTWPVSTDLRFDYSLLFTLPSLPRSPSAQEGALPPAGTRSQGLHWLRALQTHFWMDAIFCNEGNALISTTGCVHNAPCTRLPKLDYAKETKFTQGVRKQSIPYPTSNHYQENISG